MSVQQHQQQQQQQQKKSYSNPAFCQQSEFQNRSPQRNLRQSPIGAQNTRYEEQEFYEEMVVDDRGAVQEKKFVVVHNDDARPKYRYEYIPMQDSEPVKRRVYHEEIDASTGRVHRYEVLQQEQSYEPPQPPPPPQRYQKPPPPPRYPISPRQAPRYAVVPGDEDPQQRYALVPVEELANRYDYIRPVISPQPRRANPAATAKLHELLTTPKKTPQKLSTPISPIPKPQPKAQQKLNYTLATRTPDKRNTAIVAPICSSPVQSVYSETTFAKNDSFNNLSGPVQKTLAIAAFMMILCGGVTTSLCFYMISFMGRIYYLDFGAISGFTCLLLGLLGFRSRNVYWLPNRHYITGYFLLSIFSLLTAASLLVLLFMQPKPGSPLADMTSGAVCGFSALSLLMASFGIVASYCCRVPPPDNRVQHCAPGFTV
ncbi:PREDICTED: ataxin-2 homolog [Nicrophorus vespilloides]|uniref:Ataxin-2 homolog n=1 Tax=Nicrophorus vespilloides TaxID=110193 RepID=A0ABM1MD49_NICVS|nr:PREDICTED: ataxin-2 homolog [Nicrophorus vespilloides]